MGKLKCLMIKFWNFFNCVDIKVWYFSCCYFVLLGLLGKVGEEC